MCICKRTRSVAWRTFIRKIIRKSWYEVALIQRLSSSAPVKNKEGILHSSLSALDPVHGPRVRVTGHLNTYADSQFKAHSALVTCTLAGSSVGCADILQSPQSPPNQRRATIPLWNLVYDAMPWPLCRALRLALTAKT